jgi:fructose-1-phosphate kinase PfkB-like protein
MLVSVPKSDKIIHILKYISFLKPNEDEIYHIANKISNTVYENVNDCIHTLLQNGVKNILLSMGENGLIHAFLQNEKIITKHYKSLVGGNDVIINTNGFYYYFMVRLW